VRVARVAAFALLLLLALVPAASALDIEQDDGQPTDAEVGTPYSFQFLAEEGCPPSYRFSLSSGNLPPGLRVTREGKLTGIPTQAGFFDFYVQVEDDCSPGSQGYFKMKVLPDLAVATSSLPRAQPGQPYTTKLAPTNLEDGWSVTWVVLEGSLPPGLILAADGTVSGTSAAGGRWSFVVRVKEQFRRYGDRELTLIVAAPLSLPAPSTLLGEVGLPLRSALSPVGGLGPMTFAVAADSLPPGLTLDPATGMVQGMPLAAGAFATTLAVTDVGGERATTEAVFQIARRLAITTTKVPRAEEGETFGARLGKSGGIGPFRWRIVRGGPPAIRLNAATGRLDGVPRADGTYRVKIEVRDRLGARATRTFVLVVTG
jgi:large repetitive protein